jgi:hypothetical protein
LTIVEIFWFVSAVRRSGIAADKRNVAILGNYAGLSTRNGGMTIIGVLLDDCGALGLPQRGLSEIMAQVLYETFPRGRIVYDPSADIYRTFGHRRLHHSTFGKATLCAFELPGDRCALWADQHYARSLPVPSPWALNGCLPHRGGTSRLLEHTIGAPACIVVRPKREYD